MQVRCRVQIDLEVVLVEILFWIAVVALYYVYDGYLRLLQLWILLRSDSAFRDPETSFLPCVTILITVFNESKIIEDKLQNTITMDYPPDKLEVLVASDGSKDGTDDIVKGFANDQVRLFRVKKRVGKTDAQNKAIPFARGEIILFTDAETRFEKSFLKGIIAPFSDPRVGCVDGHLFFTDTENSSVAKSQRFYWNYELKLRELESQLGILAIASGACFAIRRELFLKMEPEFGEDCIVPLDIVMQGYKIVHASDAIAYDRMEYGSREEFRTRVRMTTRSLQGTWSRPKLLSPLHNPGYAFALWSHKLLRWLSPLFLVLLTVSSIWLSGLSVFFVVASLVLVGTYLAASIGWLADCFSWKLPLAGTAYSFLLANLGFLIGLFRALMGHRIVAFRRDR